MAVRVTNKLTDLVVKRLKAPGLHSDGGGLYLRVDANGSKRWAYVFQWQGKRAEMGMGGLADVSLPAARDLRDAARKLVKAGTNPIEERKVAKAGAGPALTFGEWAEEIAPDIGPKAEKARKAWVAMMKTKVGDLAKLAPAEIQTEHVLKALKPYWVSRPESGKRMRQRIERVLDAAKAKGLISEPWNNPARLKGHLENLLSKRQTAVKHRIALPFGEVAAFMAQLRQLERMPAKALEFTILTGVRNEEARLARWSEIDSDENLWTIPAERMKGEAGKKRQHRVPLTDAALAVLAFVRLEGKDAPGDLVFPHTLSGKRLSENALQDIVIDMGFKGRATVHGFRSTFRDWAGETTNFQRETIEAALAHRLGDDTERAYRRGDALLKRRKLMEAWAGFLSAKRTDNVRQLGRHPA